MTTPQGPNASAEPPPRGRRRGKGPRTGWVPGLGTARKRFLPPLPQHTDTGVIQRLSPAQLRERGIDPETVPPRRRRLVNRTFVGLVIYWRYFVTTMVALGLALCSTVSGMVAFRDSGFSSDPRPMAAAPSLDALNNAITLGERYINALYKPLPGDLAVQSEASGVPLKAYFPDSGTWVLLGEEKEVCPADECGASSSVSPIETGEKDEKYDVAFSTPQTRDALRTNIRINWAFSADQFQLTATPLAVTEPVELWLDDTKLGNYSPNSMEPLVHSFSTADQSQMRMLRFTIRHATQEAYLYWSTYGKDPKKARALAAFLERNGYDPGYDMRAPLYNRGDALGDNLPFDGGAYPDCDHVAESSDLAYAYRSKVCLFRDTYLNVGARDSFLQSWQALTTLMKYDDPNHELARGGWWLQGDTPIEVAEHLQGQWNRSGFGIPKCTPFSCNEMSNIRTSAFGALQTQLGYNYGNTTSRQFADAAAAMIVKTQIGTDGTFLMNDARFYRPTQVGAFLAAWDTGDPRFTVPSTPQLVTAVAFLVTGEQPIPPEYLGIVPSNSETSFDALGFLQMYRCEKYNVC